MRYSDELIDEIRNKNDIVDVISQYVNLKRIMLFSQTPPRLGHEGVNDGTIMVDYLPFDIRRIKTNYILHIFVPKGCLTIYKNNQDYRNLNIVEMSE